MFEPMYPDVLGAITGGTRISMDQLQCALGIFPQRTYINQPVEVILILQNMVDQSMQVKVGLQLPTQDKKGLPVVIDTPRKVETRRSRGAEDTDYSASADAARYTVSRARSGSLPDTGGGPGGASACGGCAA